MLREGGYHTAAFIYNAAQFNAKYGLNQGFDTYFFGEEDDRRPSFEKTLPAALEWIGAHRNNKFFVFLHSNDIHEPYHSPYENYFDPDYHGRLDDEYLASGNPSFHESNLTRPPREIAHIVAHYDGGIKYADEFVGKFVQQLKEWALLDRTIIVLLSDHGEILADRGMRFCHGFSLHDEEVRVPLIIAHPGINKKGVRIGTQVQLIDVMPTIFDFLGITESKAKMEGKNLVDIIAGKNKVGFNQYVYADCISGESDKEGVINYQVMVRTSSWKLISSIWKMRKDLEKSLPKIIRMHNYAIIPLPQRDAFELFKMRKDRNETKNLLDKGYRKIEEELIDQLLLFSP